MKPLPVPDHLLADESDHRLAVVSFGNGDSAQCSGRGVTAELESSLGPGLVTELAAGSTGVFAR